MGKTFLASIEILEDRVDYLQSAINDNQGWLDSFSTEYQNLISRKLRELEAHKLILRKKKLLVIKTIEEQKEEVSILKESVNSLKGKDES